MAKLHNKAGQWGKQQAASRFLWFFNTAMVFLIVLSFLGGAFIVRGMTFTSASIFMLILAVMWYTHKHLLDPMLDHWIRERIRYARGAQAEALVAWLLKDLGDDWHVFNNLMLDDASDIDHVVVGPGGVWCISTKSMRGLLTLGSGGQLLHNLKPVNWLTATKGQTMRLRDRLAALLGDDVPWINAMLAVPFVYVKFRSPHQNVHVCHQNELLGRIDESAKRLDKQQIARVSNAVKMLTDSAKSVYQRPSPFDTKGQ